MPSSSLRNDSRLGLPFQTAKNALDIAKKVDAKNKDLKNIEDLLLPSFLDGKRQLTDTFLGLVKNQELDGLGRIEEAVWRKAFYEPYTLGKQFLLKAGKLETHSGILKAHLYSGVAFYSQLLELVIASSHHQTGNLKSLKDTGRKEGPSEDSEDSHADTIHRIHLYLGDIYRYLYGLGVLSAHSLAIDHYLEALETIPENGLPHNQLAALFSEENNGLTTIYHYMACMSSKTKFEGGEKNLAAKAEEVAATKFQANLQDSQLERLLIGFSLVSSTFMGIKTNQDISQLCQFTLKDLHEILKAPKQMDQERDERTDLSPEILIQMAAMCCFVLHKNSTKKKDFDSQLALAFCLAYLSELLDGILREISDIMPEIPTEIPKPVPAKTKSRRRRQRRLSLEREESSGSEVESELESESSESDSSSDFELEESDSESESKNIILKEYQKSQLAARIQNSSFAAPLSLMCFFLHRLEQTVSGTGPGALPLWFRLTKLANALKEVATAPENGKSLSEDWFLSPVLGQIQTSCFSDDFKLRINRIRSFVKLLSVLPDTGVTFDVGSGYFFSKEKPDEIKPEERKLDEDKARTMATMWLKSEVSALENQLVSASCLVVDTSVMLKQLRIIIKLSKRFIIVVPTAVIGQLDRAKKHNPDAREAIRWLEQEFQRGSRSVRPQRHGARKSLPAVKYPKRKEKMAWSFYQILECCLYLKETMGSENSEVTLLIGESVPTFSSQLPGKSPQGLCASIGVTLKTAQDFIKATEPSNVEK
ncbi:nonsense-mediated mRNA decay factor SMG5-like isoform X1 [Artemia franciscana]|uniref:nonsense-mediated mRNA decay factor SMG5-like isoform X1 n=1 Tax=Artemia franciscana TaxID=6661 RepID=UPI0032DBD193